MFHLLISDPLDSVSLRIRRPRDLANGFDKRGSLLLRECLNAPTNHSPAEILNGCNRPTSVGNYCKQDHEFASIAQSLWQITLKTIARTNEVGKSGLRTLRRFTQRGRTNELFAQRVLFLFFSFRFVFFSVSAVTRLQKRENAGKDRQRRVITEGTQEGVSLTIPIQSHGQSGCYRAPSIGLT